MKNTTGYIEHLENTHLGSDSTISSKKVSSLTQMVVLNDLQYGLDMSLTIWITKTAFNYHQREAGTTENAVKNSAICVRRVTEV